jgi:hypothetical protein
MVPQLNDYVTADLDPADHIHRKFLLPNPNLSPRSISKRVAIALT